MRTVILVVAAVLLAPTGAHAQINVPHVFLEFTSATFNGSVGVFAYQGACAVEFPNSRMRTSLEILTSSTTPTGLIGTAYVLRLIGRRPAVLRGILVATLLGSQPWPRVSAAG